MPLFTEQVLAGAEQALQLAPELQGGIGWLATITLKLVVLVKLPAVPVTVTEYVPAGSPVVWEIRVVGEGEQVGLQDDVEIEVVAGGSPDIDKLTV